MRKAKGKFGWRRRVLLGILLVALVLIRVDTFNLTPAKTVASDYLFSIEQWEAGHFPLKWLHLAWAFLPGKKHSREERLELIEDYLITARRAKKEENRLEGLYATRGTTVASASAAKEKLLSDEYRNELLDEREKLRARAEEATEAEISAVLIEQGLGSRFGLLFPPVDVRFDQPPTVLVTSPRDRIERLEVVLLLPDMDGFERDRLEKELMARYNLSAIVDNLAGLSTYPSLVSDLFTLRTVLQTTAHEWQHSYFFFRPLGQHLYSSEEMSTLNETAADLAGRELGDITFARMGGDLSVSSSRYLSGEERDPIFTRKMRETRTRVDQLLAQGKIEEAEQYMKERQWHLRLGGYGIRKLNQAYFAFRGSYAEGAGSISPIGDEVKELRDLVPNIRSFIQTISGVSSYEEFLNILERHRAQEGNNEG